MNRFVIISMEELDYNATTRRGILTLAYEKFRREHPRYNPTNLVMMWEEDFNVLLKIAETDKNKDGTAT